MSYYTGVGSRETPEKHLKIMVRLATIFERKGWILRSGGAYGADSAFYEGVKNKSNAQIFVPWNGYTGMQMKWPIPQQAFELAAQVHPVWDKLSDPVKKLHARNAMQVLGPNLDQPSSFLMCYTKDGCINDQTRSSKTGGTGTAICIASRNNIKVYNLSRDEHLLLAEKFISENNW